MNALAISGMVKRLVSMLRSAPEGRGPAPFLIWTVQRSGGTNFVNWLHFASDATEYLLHEPLNKPREFGAITASWMKTQNSEKLSLDLDAFCAQRRNIKHCVEMVPDEVNRELVLASVKHGYRHLFLYREDACSRLLSLEFARRTKIWGPGKARAAEQAPDVFEKPLNLEDLVEHERKCRNRMAQAAQTLTEMQVPYQYVSFEHLYADPADRLAPRIVSALNHLGITQPSDGVFAMIAKMRNSGNQGTRDEYARFKGIEELKAALDALPAKGSPLP